MQNLFIILELSRNLIDFTYKIQENILTNILCINLILPLVGIFIGSFLSILPKIINIKSNSFKIQHNIAL
jgi:hypothetical protein